jgi:hypothetical protein
MQLARLKLLCGEEMSLNGLLAAVSTRVLFEFEPRREAAQTENELVASHMRVVFSIPQHRYYMRTGTPSEPILAEAAARLMFEKFTKQKSRDALTSQDSRQTILNLLQDWVCNGLLEKGELGELVARTLLTFAHDLALEDTGAVPETLDSSEPLFTKPIRVVDFFRALFREKFLDLILKCRPGNDDKGPTLAQAFSNAYVHFTHFGRTKEGALLVDEAAFAGMCRGMAWTFYRSQRGVDIGIPVFMGKPDEPLDRYKMTMIFIQVKNTWDAKNPVIDMDSSDYNFFSSKGTEDERPYITIVMNLGVRHPTVKTGTSSIAHGKTTLSHPIEWGTTPSKVQIGASKSRSSDRRSETKHHRYSFNVHGCSGTVYRVINSSDTGEKAKYAQILASRDMLQEHPRKESEFWKAIVNQKPYWQRGPDSFGWIEPYGSRGALASVFRILQTIEEEEEVEWVSITKEGGEHRYK